METLWHAMRSVDPHNNEPTMQPISPNTTPPQDFISAPRYSTEELAGFGSIIRKKIAAAEEDLQLALGALSRAGSNGTEDTYGGNKGFDEGNAAVDREELMMLAYRQRKFINELNLALGRIRSGTYGICRASGARIPKERLRAVPHTTLCIAAKQGGSATV
jgi:DnaK suppressor protein